jgi:superfamily II DNA/RNA helicase
LQAIVFAINVEHSKAIADRYNQAGIAAAHLDGKTPDKVRAETIAAFRRGEIRVLANCNLFDEGFDLPSLGCVQIARPTQSLGKYLQMLGRGARPEKGKDCAIYIDHTQNYLIHGLPDADRAWSLDGVKSDLRPIGIDADGRVEPLTEDNAEREGKAIVELEYVVLERVRRISWPDDIVERYRECGSANKLAKELGVSATSLKRHLRSLGVKITIPKPVKISWPDDIVERYRERGSVRKLAKELGVGATSLKRHLRSLGVEIISTNAKKELPVDIAKIYLADPKTKKLARELGCDSSRLSKHLRSLGVEIINTSAKKELPVDTVDRYRADPNVAQLAKEMKCSRRALARHLRSLGIDTSKKPKSSREGNNP